MPDIVKPLKIETLTDGSQVDPFPTEVNPSQDYLAAKGISFNKDPNIIAYESGSEIYFKDATVTTPRALCELVNFSEIPIVDGGRVSTTSFVIKLKFRFHGTSYYKTPLQIAIIGNVETGVTAEVKLFDFTNSKQIALKTNIANIATQIIDLGALANLPTTEAIFELQVRRLTGSGGVLVWGASLKW